MEGALAENKLKERFSILKDCCEVVITKEFPVTIPPISNKLYTSKTNSKEEDFSSMIIWFLSSQMCCNSALTVQDHKMLALLDIFHLNKTSRSRLSVGLEINILTN